MSLEVLARSRAADSSFTLRLNLLACAPTEEQQICPITHDSIGSPAYSLPPIAIPPKKRHKKGEDDCLPPVAPGLHCMQISECGHCFDGRALLIHFMRNSMNCPLCRCGNAIAVLDAKKSFPDAPPWVAEAEQASLQSQEPPRRRMRILATFTLHNGETSEHTMHIILGLLHMAMEAAHGPLAGVEPLEPQSPPLQPSAAEGHRGGASP